MGHFKAEPLQKVVAVVAIISVTNLFKCLVVVQDNLFVRLTRHCSISLVDHSQL